MAMVDCYNDGKCFAKHMFGKAPMCSLLNQSYPPGKCPFQKARREESNGKLYPVSKYYQEARKKAEEEQRRKKARREVEKGLDLIDLTAEEIEAAVDKKLNG